MRHVQPWTDEDIIKKEVKSCDNHDMGDIKEVDTDLIFTEKGGKRFQIPRESIAIFDGDKVWLRATEAEVVAGVYPFIDDDREERLDNSTTSIP